MKKLFILLILGLVLVSGCNGPGSLIQGLGRCNHVLDCGKNQYCEAGAFKCRDIINECETNNDCSGHKTCETREISTSWACPVGEGCPKVYHNVCELTEETKRYCEQDSDCGIQSTCCCIEPLNKKYVTEITCNMENILCSPCKWHPDYIAVKCVNNQCTFVPKTVPNK